jgi:uncharacterized membrane protein (GlpM family)
MTVSMPTFFLIRWLVTSQKWGIPQLSLSTYLRFWSVICFSVTIWLTFFQKEVGICLAQVHAINEPNLSAKGNLQGRGHEHHRCLQDDLEHREART